MSHTQDACIVVDRYSLVEEALGAIGYSLDLVHRGDQHLVRSNLDQTLCGCFEKFVLLCARSRLKRSSSKLFAS